jgi:hypothetical protein
MVMRDSTGIMHVDLRAPPGIIDAIDDLAEHHMRSRNSEIVVALREYIVHSQQRRLQQEVSQEIQDIGRD